MPEVVTSKTLNVSQLAAELGGVPLRAVGPDDDGNTLVAVQGGTKAALDAAVDGHTAAPAWVDPGYVPPPDTATPIDAVRARAQEVLAGTGTFTAAQMQKILAALVLRTSR